jgi:hypothetical protein
LTSAGVLALAVFGFVEYGHRAGSERMAKNSPPPAAMQRDESAPAAPAQNRFKPEEKASPASAAEAGSGGEILQKDQHEPTPPPKFELSRNFAKGSLAHGPRQNQWQQQNINAFQMPGRAQGVPEAKQAVVPPTAPAVSGKSEMVEVESQSAQLEASQVTDSVVAENKPMPQPLPPSLSDAEVSRAKSAPAAAPSQAAASALESQGRTLLALQVITPTWTVNSGRLQRSLDQGQTWQNVNVTASANTGASLDLAVASSKAGKPRKDKKAVSTAPVFRAVAANGPNVWAGGTAGLLYHSSDAGAHWARVKPSSESATLSGDILSLEFPDAENGRISTSTGEVWTTADNGQSWKKQ